MLRSIVKYFFLPFFITFMTALATSNDLRFHLMAPLVLTPGELESFESVSFDRAYEVNQAMKFKVEIRSHDGKKDGTLFWPGEELSRIFILAPHAPEGMPVATAYSGRLVRCVYQCEPSGMLIGMDDFAKLVSAKFPGVAKDSLPQAVLDTGQKREGLVGYFKLYRRVYVVIGIVWGLAVAAFLSQIGKGSKPRGQSPTMPPPKRLRIR